MRRMEHIFNSDLRYIYPLTLKDKKYLNKDCSNMIANRIIQTDTDFKNSDFSNSVINVSEFTNCNFENVNFEDTSFFRTILAGSCFKNANFTNCNLVDVCLGDADLSGAKGLLSPIDWLNENFEKTDDGYIAYKVFNVFSPSPSYWNIKEGEIINEVVNPDRTSSCGSGISVATLKWLKDEDYLKLEENDIWKLLIKWEWLSGVVVPYNTCGEFRCERAMILERVDIND